ncbi:MAG: hypothetical protein IJO72_01855 [Oscillospiraceae bacterium]|nr:hypothetical protein [Oscillospiraceae bacterium]
MDLTQKIFAGAFVIASWLVLVAAIIWLCKRTAKNRQAPEKQSRTGINTALAVAGWLLLSIFLLRFAVGYYSVVVSENPSQELEPAEKFAESIFKAIRTFSLEEEYDAYILGIKGLLAALIPAGCWFLPVAQAIMVVFATLQNLAAPVFGGAIILEILASKFPKIQLWFVNHFSKRLKCYFSELNPASLALAKSRYYAKEGKKPILIFTDTYVDDEEEKESELLLEAKKFGAICLQDDLIHVAKTEKGDREFYLMDQNELGNLQTLMGLVEEQNAKYLKNAVVYLFVQTDTYVKIEKQINKKLGEEKYASLFKGGEKPTIIPINAYRNLVQNLFVDLPLFEPLIRKQDKTKLNLTILGNGTIGTEAFLSAYWFGQMLISRSEGGWADECELTINIGSNDTEEAFWSKIDYINSEIRDTVRVLRADEWEETPDLLMCVEKPNKPYCSVRYVKVDVKVDGFWDSKDAQEQKLLESDYFIVALGNDADNISIAEKLRRLIGKKHLEEAVCDTDTKDSDDVVITYAVFDSALVEMLNEKKAYQCRQKGVADIYMYAFGSIEQVYSYANINMTKSALLAIGTGKAYDNAQSQMIVDNKKRKNDESRNYSYWADLARAMHIRYKAFSLGLIRESVFDHALTQRDHEKYITERCRLYKQIAKKEDAPEQELVAAEAKKHLLAWLEHRRWTAFTRTMGYQFTAEFKKNLQLNGANHKNMELKLHPCLVEAEKPKQDAESTYLRANLGGLFEDLSVTVSEELPGAYRITVADVFGKLDDAKTVAFALKSGACDPYRLLTAALESNSRLQEKLETLLKTKKSACVALTAQLPDSGEIWPVTIQVKGNGNKKKLLAVFKVADLNTKQLITLLRMQKNHFEAKMQAAAAVDQTGFDPLDQLTVNWCHEAARYSLVQMKDLLKRLESNEDLQTLKETYAAIWYGVGSYDFKTYDYYAFDFE